MSLNRVSLSHNFIPIFSKYSPKKGFIYNNIIYKNVGGKFVWFVWKIACVKWWQLVYYVTEKWMAVNYKGTIPTLSLAIKMWHSLLSIKENWCGGTHTIYMYIYLLRKKKQLQIVEGRSSISFDFSERFAAKRLFFFALARERKISYCHTNISIYI